MNEFIMGYSVGHVNFTPLPGPASPSGSINKPPTWTAKNLFAPNATNPLLPGIQVCGGAAACFGENADNFPWHNSNPIITWKDNVVYTRGKHTVKFGFFFEDYRKNEQFGFETQGLVSFFNGTPISTGNALADMELGRIANYQEGTQTINGQPIDGYPKGHWRLTDFEPYIHDDWKVGHNLTLNLGMRYYLFSRIHDVSNPTVDSNFLHPFGRGLTFQASYTWSDAIDDASATWFRSFVDDSNLGRWRATSDLNRTQLLVMNYIYGRGVRGRRPCRFSRRRPTGLPGMRSAAGRSAITSFFTGTPIDVGCGITGFGNGIGTGLRCNSLGPVKIKKGVDNDPQFGPTPTWFDGNTFARPLESQLRADGQPGMFGTMGRNPLTGPGRNNWDMALLKDFQLPWFGGEHSTLQFRWETFNTFNHPQ